MGYIKDNYQTIKQFFKDVKNGINDIGLRLDGLESRREDVLGGGLTQEEENGKEYKAGEGILITDDDSIVLDYNGPFAYQLDHIDTTTTTTLWVTRSVGYVVRNGLRKTVYANTTPAAMASGESAWMLYNTDADSYSISIQTNAPTATSNKICVKLAENVNGVLRQIQFGEVVVVATGGGGGTLGFPDYAHPYENISIGADDVPETETRNYSFDAWIIGYVVPKLYYGLAGSFTVSSNNNVIINKLIQSRVSNLSPSGEPTQNSIGLIDAHFPIIVPFAANTPIEFSTTNCGADLTIYPVLTQQA